MNLTSRKTGFCVLSTTQSLCPVCMERIPAVRALESNTVFLDKTCPRHGRFRARIWKGGESFQAWTRPKIPIPDRFSMTPVQKGCPFDCGLCPEHRQHTCTAVLEITSRCNLACRFCFARSGTKGRDLSLAQISRMLDSVRRVSPRANIQISGGEPTLCPDLPRIIEQARKTGFEFVQLNTNGVRISREKPMARTLKSAGLSSVFLQFDGTSDLVYQALRGQDLFDIKQEAVSSCVAAGLGVVLVPTLVPGINISQINAILQFALDRVPGIRGVHFQPAAWFGRHPGLTEKATALPAGAAGPGPGDRLTLPEVLEEIQTQTQGKFRQAHFRPPGCEHSLCSFTGKFLIQDPARPLALTGPDTGCCSPIPAEQGAARARAATAMQWTAPEPHPAPGAIRDGLDLFLDQARSHLFSVSGMAFQDIWNLDLERLKGCCIHSVAPDGRLIPFCAFNLTSATGKGVYRR